MAGWLCLVCALGAVFLLRPGVDEEKDDSVAVDRSRMTKPNSRDRDEREIGKKNPRVEFEAARKRGMTEEEVRKVVEDYYEATAYEDQPERPVEVVLYEMREKKLNLYLDALAEGFNLTEEQKLEAQAKLPTLAAQHVDRLLLLDTVDRAWELSLTAEGAKNLTPIELTRSEQIEVIARSSLNLAEEGMRPWELCELDERQKEMIGYEDDAGEWIWVNGDLKTLDFGKAEFYGALRDPFAEGANVMDMAGEIFPLSMRQVERLGVFQDEVVSSDSQKLKPVKDLERVKLLSRPQLKTLLLFSSDMPGKLMDELEE